MKPRIGSILGGQRHSQVLNRSARRAEETKNKKRKNHLFSGILMVIIFLGVANIVLACHLATAGEKMKTLTEEIHQLEKTNENLQKKVVQLGSYAQVSQRAASLGFTQAKAVVYLKGQPPLAMR